MFTCQKGLCVSLLNNKMFVVSILTNVNKKQSGAFSHAFIVCCCIRTNGGSDASSRNSLHLKKLKLRAKFSGREGALFRGGVLIKF